MMINYETIVDGVSAIIVILSVATIIAAAWISTNVREQPLIATAVVVFQRQSDGENTEQNSNEEGTASNPTSRTNTADTSISSTPVAPSAAPTAGPSVVPSAAPSVVPSAVPSAAPSAAPSVAPSVRPKEPRSQIKGDVNMESSNKEKDKEVMNIERSTECKEGVKLENKQDEQIGDVEIKKDDGICLEENSSANEIKSSSRNLEKCHEEKGEYLDKCDILDSKNDSSIATSTSASLPIQKESLTNKTNEITPEMEIRNRRLKHFISMGNDGDLGIKSETIVENNLYEETSCKKVTDSKENSKIFSDTESSVSESSPLEVSADKNPADVLEEKEELVPPPPGSIRIRLKFLDDSLRFVHALPTDLIGHFKRQQFSLEISENRQIRLIFAGQLLSSDSSTLAHYGLFDNCVVHCHVSAPRPTPESSSNNVADLQHDDDDTFMSGLLAPLLYCVLMVMWYLRYQYGHLFNTCSSIILLCLTALLLISTYLLYTTQQQQQQPPSSATSSSNHNSSTLNTNTVGQITLGAS